MIILGIDFGTTSLKICVINEKKEILFESQRHHDSEFSQGQQNAEKTILMAVQMIEDARGKISLPINNISIAGQMHGIVLWNADALANGSFVCSPLFTWQYNECDKKLIDEMNKLSPSPVYAGYGCVTLSHLFHSSTMDSSIMDTRWNMSGTIMDMFTAYLLGSNEGTISEQNANSWGLYGDGKWILNKITNFPPTLLPKIVPSGTVLPGYQIRISNLENCTISVPIGDLQAAVFPLVDDNTAVLNLGTSIQICLPVSLTLSLPHNLSHLRIDPFHSKRNLLLAPGLNGGTALNTFIKLISSWNEDLSGVPQNSIDYETVIRRINETAERKRLLEDSDEHSLTFRPTFDGERGMDDLNGAQMNGIKRDTNIMNVLLSLCEGIIDNIFCLLPASLLSSTLGVSTLTLTGSANEPRFLHSIRRNLPNMNIINGKQSVSAAYGTAVFGNVGKK